MRRNKIDGTVALIRLALLMAVLLIAGLAYLQVRKKLERPKTVRTLYFEGQRIQIDGRGRVMGND